MSQQYRILFAGTPEFAAGHLAALIEAKYQVVGVYTQPDRPAGRGKKLQASAVKQLAQEHGLPVYQPESLKSDEEAQKIAEFDADFMIVVAYGLILPAKILSLPKFGCINVHGSLLPKWRGAAPIQRAIWAGDKVTGITTMLMDAGLDTGDMLLKSEIAISDHDTSATLFQKMAESGPKALLDTLSNFPSITPEKQNDLEATYAKKLSKQEGFINWSDSAEQIERNIRAFTPWPSTQCKVNDQFVKVWQASVTEQTSTSAPGTIVAVNKNAILVATGTVDIALETLQVPGKKAVPVGSVLQSKADWFMPGNKLESEY